MDTRKRQLPALSLGRTLHTGQRTEPVSRVPERVSGDGVAPDRSSETEHEVSLSPSPDVLRVVLIIPLRQWVSFSKYIQGNVRVIKPKGFDGEITLHVLPDLGDDMVDFDQYETPTVDLTLLKAALKP